MDSIIFLKEEISKIEKQRLKNEKETDRDEVVFKQKMKNINEKIKKARLKSTFHELKQQKQQLKDDYNFKEYISYKCEQSIGSRLGSLYDRLHKLSIDE